MRIRIDIEKSRDTGHLFASSKGLQGFHAHGENLEELARGIVSAIQFVHDFKKSRIGEVSLILGPESLSWDEGKAFIFADYEILQVEAA